MGIRGQVAAEYVLLVGLLLLLITPFLYFGFQSSGQQSRLLQAEKLVSDLAQAADYVYSQGAGSRVTVSGIIPGGVTFEDSYIGKPPNATGNITSKIINLVLQINGIDHDVWKETGAELCISSQWPSDFGGAFTGPVLFTIEVEDEGCVSILPFDVGFFAEPPVIVTDCITVGASAGFVITLTNNDEANPVTISVSGSGAGSSFMSFNNTNVTIPADGTEKILMTITIPTGTSLGVHFGSVVFQSNDTVQEVPVDILVCGTTDGNQTTEECCNATLLNYTISLFEGPACTIPRTQFFRPATSTFSSSGWPPSTALTLDIKNSTNSSLSGFPATVNSSGSGLFTYIFDPTSRPIGNYTVYVNDSNFVVSDSMVISQCPV